MTKFLVNAISDGEEWSKIMTAAEIFEMMDMSDCYDIDIDVWKINGWGQALTECCFLNCWHDPSDPLKMQIRWVGGMETGYGTDH